MHELRLHPDVSLQTLNTFGIEARARWMTEITHPGQLDKLRPFVADQPYLLLGGGSNILLTRDFDGLVVKVSIPGIGLKEDGPDHVLVEVGAGVNWHEFVTFSVDNGWYGIENLALIPGQTGTAPIQNIGAYGAEVCDVIDEVSFYDFSAGAMTMLDAGECRFGYRDSIFKHELKGSGMICSVTFRLSKVARPDIAYRALREYMDRAGISDPSPQEVMQAVIAIRQSKLPDPAVIGNAGSFFKNPVVSKDLADGLLSSYPSMPVYPAPGGDVKIAAGWLIETAGWKGRKMRNAGVHDRQALVLVNQGNASGAEVLELARSIISDVKTRFGIELAPEVNII